MTSADAFMAINCIDFPTARDYKYFIFSSDATAAGEGFFESEFLITPCQNDTSIQVRPSQTQLHPSWVSPSDFITGRIDL